MGILDSILRSKRERTLLVVTEEDIRAMDKAQKRQFNNGEHYAVALFAPHDSEIVQQCHGLNINTQFRSISGLIDKIKDWGEPYPEKIRVSNKMPQAAIIDRELTKAFLNTETEIEDFLPKAKGARRA